MERWGKSHANRFGLCFLRIPFRARAPRNSSAFFGSAEMLRYLLADGENPFGVGEVSQLAGSELGAVPTIDGEEEAIAPRRI